VHAGAPRPRRHALRTALCWAATIATPLPRVSRAQGPGPGPATATASSWPRRPIQLVIGFPPGGNLDFTARAIQGELEAGLGQPLVIEYRAGANGVLAASELVRAPADGYTLLLANTGPFAIAPSLLAQRPYDPATQFSYIGQVSETAYVAATRVEHPAADLRQFAQWARANDGRARFASAGAGSTTHLHGELFNSAAGLRLQHVPYRGNVPALTDVIGGQVHLVIDTCTTLLSPIRGGFLKALAVTGPRRDSNLPDVPTVRELGFEAMEATGFQGLVGPPGLPAAIVQRLAAELARALGADAVRQALAASGSEARPRDPRQFAAHVQAEGERWAALIALLAGSGLRPA